VNEEAAMGWQSDESKNKIYKIFPVAWTETSRLEHKVRNFTLTKDVIESELNKQTRIGYEVVAVVGANIILRKTKTEMTAVLNQSDS